MRRDTVLVKWRYSALHRLAAETDVKDTGRNQLIITGVYAIGWLYDHRYRCVYARH